MSIWTYYKLFDPVKDKAICILCGKDYVYRGEVGGTPSRYMQMHLESKHEIIIEPVNAPNVDQWIDTDNVANSENSAVVKLPNIKQTYVDIVYNCLY